MILFDFPLICVCAWVCLRVRLCVCVGLGDMAVSNTIGSNVFDILVGLGVPWAIQTMAVDYGSAVRMVFISSSFILFFSSSFILSFSSSFISSFSSQSVSASVYLPRDDGCVMTSFPVARYRFRSTAKGWCTQWCCYSDQ